MNNQPSIFYQRPDETLVPLPTENLDKAVVKLSQELIDGHLGGQLCTLRTPVKPNLKHSGQWADMNWMGSAVQWLGTYLPPAKGSN